MSAFEHVRPDGTVVKLTGPRWRLELRREGRIIEVPQEWLTEHRNGARVVTLRKIAEPIVWPESLTSDVLRAVDAMARLKSGEREAFEQALREGRSVTLKNLLRGLDGRRARGIADKVSTKDLVRRVNAIEEKAIDAIAPETVTRLDAWLNTEASR